MSPCELLTFLLVGSVCLASLVDGQKKNKPPRWKPKSRPFNGDNIIAKSSGSDIKLSCPAYGYPKPKITWYKEGNLFDASQRPKTKARHFALSLNDVQTSDSGKYKCVVQNSEGSLEFTFIVDVIRTSWPLELEEPQNATVMEGERVVFRCRALNDPDATTQWIKRDTDGGDAGGSSKDFLPSNGPEIVIENASPQDAGKYTCMVGNYIGIKSVDVWLTVRQTTTTTTTTTTTKPPTTTTTTTTTTTPTTTTTTTRKPTTTTTTTTPRPTTTSPVIQFPYLPDTTDDEDLEGGSGNDMEKEKKKKKKKKKNKKKKKKNKKKKKKERQRERERKQQQREKKRKEELDRMNKEDGMDNNRNIDIYPDFSNPNIFKNNQGGFEPNFPFLSTTPPSEDEDIFTNSGNPDSDRLPINRDTFQDFPAGTQQHSEEEEGMSAWTIYIIVGLVAGGVLLVGLVAIVVALCCNRIEDRNGYKHTSV